MRPRSSREAQADADLAYAAWKAAWKVAWTPTSSQNDWSVDPMRFTGQDNKANKFQAA